LLRIFTLELRIQERHELEAYLKKLGVDDLATLFTTEQLNSLEKESQSNPGKSQFLGFKVGLSIQYVAQNYKKN